MISDQQLLEIWQKKIATITEILEEICRQSACIVHCDISIVIICNTLWDFSLQFEMFFFFFSLFFNSIFVMLFNCLVQGLKLFELWNSGAYFAEGINFFPQSYIRERYSKEKVRSAPMNADDRWFWEMQETRCDLIHSIDHPSPSPRRGQVGSGIQITPPSPVNPPTLRPFCENALIQGCPWVLSPD